ncbi:MAG: FAD:protein FMN transferase [Cellvibrionaceae bacterium]
MFLIRAIKKLFSQSLFLIKFFLRCFLYTTIFLLTTVAHAEWLSDEQSIMGTSVSVTLWHDDPVIGEQAIAAVMAEMRRIDETFSPYKPASELSVVNREAFKKPLTMSSELTAIIDKALFYSRVSQGAFDITFASVGKHYDYRNKQQPTDQQREELIEAINYQFIQVDKKTNAIKFLHPNVQIDLGGIAKGYAVDRGAQILTDYQVTNATISAGGDSRIVGDKRGEPWVIGIKKPRGLQASDAVKRDQVAIMLPLENTAISTSGDYERFFINEKTGERVHHILNPKTGKSASGIVSVSVIGPVGFDTDPLSTTVFVLGVEKGLKLINKFKGFDCVIIDSAGNVHYSEGLEPPVNPA